MSEKFTTLGSAVLSGSILAGATSLVVTSSVNMPTDGTFRIRIDAEIFKCTAVSGSTYTVVSESFTGNAQAAHTSGAEVIHVLTAESLSAFRKEAQRLITVGTVGADYLTDGTADDVQLNAAIVEQNAAGGGLVLVLPGSYYIANPVHLLAGVTLAGSGAGVTKFVVATGFPDETVYYAVGCLGGPTTGTAINLTSNVTPGLNVIPLTTGSELALVAVDDYVFLCSDDVWETTNTGGRKRGEYCRVLSVASNSITIRGMVRDTYTTAATARVYRMSLVEDIGVRHIEFLQQDALGTRSGVSLRSPAPMVSFQYARNPYVEKCKIHKSDGPGATVYQCVSALVNDCTIHDLTDDTTNNRLGYGVLVGGASEGVIVSGNNIARVRHGVDAGPSNTATLATSNFGIPRAVAVTGNVVTHATNSAYSTHNEAENWHIAGNVASNCDTWAVFMRGRNCRIMANTIEWCGQGVGIGSSNFSSQGGSGSGCKVVGNTISHIHRLVGLSGAVAANGEGIVTALCDNVEISGNIISNCDHAGIRLETGTVRSLFKGNTILNANLLNAVGSSSEAFTIDASPRGTDGAITAFDGTDATISTATTMFSFNVGRVIVVSGAANSANNGSFTVSAFVDSTHIKYTNAAAVFPEANALTYYIECTTDNTIEHNFAENTVASRYDRDTVGHMQYFARDYGTSTGGNLRNEFVRNRGYGMVLGDFLGTPAGTHIIEHESTKGVIADRVPTNVSAATAPAYLLKAATTSGATGGDLNLSSGGGGTTNGALNLQINGVTIVAITASGQLQFPFDIAASPRIAFSGTAASPKDLDIRAQGSSGATAGGNLLLSAGAAGSGSAGQIRLCIGGNQGVVLDVPNNAAHGYLVASGVTSVSFGQTATTTANGASWTLAAQTSSFAGSTGGALNLSSGNGVTAAGNVNIKLGGTTQLAISPTDATISLPIFQFVSTLGQSGKIRFSGTNASAQDMDIRAQSGSGAASNGANLLLSCGAPGSSGSNGQIRFCVNGNQGVVLDVPNDAAHGYLVASGVTSASFGQTTTTTANGAGWSITAQSSSFAGSTGGSLTLGSGTGVTANGNVLIQRGGSTKISLLSTGVNIDGTLHPTGGALTTGNVLGVTGAGAVSYAALNLAGGANYVTGVLPIANQASQTMAGDVTGTTSAAVVAKINGSTVPTGGALTTGNTLGVTGAGALSYGALNLAGGVNYVTGVLPSANQASQTMAGDVTGTTAASVVSAITGSSPLNVTPATIQWLTGTASPTLSQASTSSASGATIAITGQASSFDTGTGGTVSISGGNSTGATTGTGGSVNISAGTGTTSTGAINFRKGSSTAIQLTPNNTGTTTIQFVAGVTAATINQGASSSASGATMSLSAQATSFDTGTGGALALAAGNSTGATTGTGGNVTISSGTGTTTNGTILFRSGSTTAAQLTPNGTGATTLQFVAGCTSVTLNHGNNTTNGATGAALTVNSQNATGTTSIGGALNLVSGTGTSTNGAINLKVGGTTVASLVTGKFVSNAGKRRNVTAVTAASYTVLATDDFITVNRAGAVAITLPASPTTGDTHKFKDISGAALANTITITPAAGNIDGAANKIIVGNYGSLTLTYTGSEWSVT